MTDARMPLPDPVQMLVLDCDGVLTDGGMYFSAEGQALKRFDVKDGLALSRLASMGFTTAVLSGDDSAITARRCEALSITHTVLGRLDKEDALRELLAEAGIPAEAVVYMGDDVTDIAPLRMVGLGVAPADAVDEVRAAAGWVTQRPGGRGAVREVCDAIMAQLERHDRAVPS